MLTFCSCSCSCSHVSPLSFCHGMIAIANAIAIAIDRAQGKTWHGMA